jgi:hypothetical protein
MKPVSVTLGGIPRTLRIELGHAPNFEAATGLGVFTLYKVIHERSVTTTQLVETLRTAFAVNDVKYSPADIFEMIKADGLIEAYVTAELLIMQLFLTPEGTKEAAPGKKSKPAGARSNASH